MFAVSFFSSEVHLHVDNTNVECLVKAAICVVLHGNLPYDLTSAVLQIRAVSLALIRVQYLLPLVFDVCDR